MKSLKKILGLIALMLMVVIVLPSGAQTVKVDKAKVVATIGDTTNVEAGTITATVPPYAPRPPEKVSIGEFLLTNWEALLFALLALAKVIVNLTPSTKDNKVFALLDNLINWIVPNLKKGGGTHAKT